MPTNDLKYSLCVHDENYSKQDLLINSDLFHDGELVIIELKALALTLTVTLRTDLKPLQISLSNQIASQFDLQPRTAAQIKKINDFDSVRHQLP